jgi:hypothetical protein
MRNSPITFEMCLNATPPICDEGFKHFSMLELEGKSTLEVAKLIEDNIPDAEIVEWWKQFLNSDIVVTYYGVSPIDEYRVSIKEQAIYDLTNFAGLDYAIHMKKEHLKQQLNFPLYVKISDDPIFGKSPLILSSDSVPSSALGFYVYNLLTATHEHFDDFNTLIDRKYQIQNAIINTNIIVEQKYINEYGDYIWQSMN